MSKICCASVLSITAAVGLASSANAGVISDWNQIALDAIVAGGTAPPAAARALAMTHAAMFDAVNSINGSYKPFRFFDTSAPSASREASAISAAHAVLTNLYPSQAATLNSARDNALAGISNGAAKTSGIAIGQSIASQMNAWRATDGSSAVVSFPGSTAPGRYRPPADNQVAAALPHWQYVTPFAMTSPSQFRPPAPPALNTSTYADAVNEVKAIGSKTSATRTAEQADIARAWAFGGGTVTPPGAWNKIAQTISSNANLSILEESRMFGMLNVALADAGIAAWDTKYNLDFWRPIDAIRLADQAGNSAIVQDAAWEPLLKTPNHPSYTSGHSTFSRAAATALASFLGTDSINVSFQGDFGVNRQLTSLNDAANEAGLSRIYGGIHYNFDNIEGQNAGLAVGNLVAANSFIVPAPGAATLLGLGSLLAARRRR